MTLPMSAHPSVSGSKCMTGASHALVFIPIRERPCLRQKPSCKVSVTRMALVRLDVYAERPSPCGDGRVKTNKQTIKQTNNQTMRR